MNMYSPRVPYKCALGTKGERHHLCLARDELGLELMLTLALKIKKFAWQHGYTRALKSSCL